MGKVIYYNNEFDLNKLIDNLLIEDIKNYKIFIIKNNFSIINNNDLRVKYNHVKYQNVDIITMDYTYLIVLFRVYINNMKNKSEIKIHNFLDDILHNLSFSSDIKPLFIFEDFSLFNIIKILKLININFTGGNIPRRHLLSSLEYDLFIYLNAIFKQSGLNIKNIRKLIYDSYNTKFLTKTTINNNEIFSAEPSEISQLHEFNIEAGLFFEYLSYLESNFKKIDDINSKLEDHKNKVKSASNNKKRINKSVNISFYNQKIDSLNLELSSFKKQFKKELFDYEFNSLNTKLENINLLKNKFFIKSYFIENELIENLFKRLNKFTSSKDIINSHIIKSNINNSMTRKYSTINNLNNEFYPIYNYLGLSIDEYINQSKLKKTNIEWKYGDTSYLLLKDFFNLNEDLKLKLLNDLKSKLLVNNTYALTPIFIPKPTYDLELENKIFNLSSQIIVTNLIDINKLEAWLLGLYEYNLLSYGSLINDGSLIIKYRIISISLNTYEKISSKEMLNIPIRNKKEDIGIDKYLLKNNIFPNSINLTDYGILKSKNVNFNGINGDLYNYKKDINILVEDSINNGETIRQCYVYKKNNLVIEYIDNFNEINNFFNRKLKNKILTINKNNNMILNLDEIIKCNYITKDKRVFLNDTKILSFDIETFVNSNKILIPYSIGYYDGLNTHLYYLTDFNNSLDMVEKCILDMLTNYNKYTVYVHNLSNFDSLFIIKMLISSKKIKFEPFYKNNKLYSLNLSLLVNKKIHSLTFRDSYLLLNTSLRKLAIDFKVPTLKGVFPYTFINGNNLDYIGELPSYNYYMNDLNYNDYVLLTKNYISQNWSVKVETLRYLTSDLLCLYEIILKFNDEIFELENINITDVLSISSLTFKIFKTNFLKNNKLPIVKSKHQVRLREAFYGGRVDVFKTIGHNVYVYDVNSLYPYIMANYDLPIGKMVMSFDNNLDNYFGYCYVEVETPKFMHKPLLPFRGDDGNLYYPLGTWKGMYFSEELKNAINFGYKFKIIYGYKFERGSKIFYDMNLKYYDLKKYARLNNLPSKATVSKLIMNSLFGRFGMKEIKNIVKIVSKEESKYIHLQHNVLDNIPLSDDLEYIKYSSDINQFYLDIFGIDNYNLFRLKIDNYKDLETSLPVAMAITAYARIFMSQFINNEFYDVIYSDTDSIVTTKNLPIEWVGDGWGKFKLEHHAEYALFIAPKLYYLRLFNGETVLKARTLGGELLNENDFLDLSYGLTVKNLKFNFVKDLNNLNLLAQNSFLELSPFLKKRIHHISNVTGQFDKTSPLYVKQGIIEKNNLPIINTNIIQYKPQITSLPPFSLHPPPLFPPPRAK